MSRFVAFYVSCAAFSVGLSAHAAGAQAPGGRVALSVTVLPHATIERVSLPVVVRRAGDTTEYRIAVAVWANMPYRVVARRAGSAASRITFGVHARTMWLDADRAAVQVARGELGATTFEITYSVDGDRGGESAPPVRFEALADTLVSGER